MVLFVIAFSFIMCTDKTANIKNTDAIYLFLKERGREWVTLALFISLCLNSSVKWFLSNVCFEQN